MSTILNLTTKQIENKIQVCEKNMDLFQKQLQEQVEKGMSDRAQQISQLAYHRWKGQYDIWTEVLINTKEA